jgi:hypothetical protein
MRDPKKAALAYVVEISEAELAVRMCEANYSLTRPPGCTSQEALDAMDADVSAAWQRSARAAMDYWRECIEAGSVQ